MAALMPCSWLVADKRGKMRPCGVLSEQGKCPDHRRAYERRRLDKNPFRWLYKDPRWGAVTSEVVARDGYRCTFTVGTRRCISEGLLEVHHEEKLRHIWERCGSPQRGGAGWNRFIAAACDKRKLRTLCVAHHKHIDNNDPREAKAIAEIQSTSQARRHLRSGKRRTAKRRSQSNIKPRRTQRQQQAQGEDD